MRTTSPPGPLSLLGRGGESQRGSVDDWPDRPFDTGALLTVDGVSKRFVTRRYDTTALDDVSFEIEPGALVTLLGPSGCGKTTTLRLIAGLERPTSGRIRIGDDDVTTLPATERDVSMVFQSYALFPHMTVLENVAYGLSVSGWKKAEAHDFIANLNDAHGRTGYEAHVGERGVKLSGGQRQRVAIARVLLKDAPILVLDEATSALDSEVEAAIQEQLVNLMEGKTVIAIAHRLSTIAAMDRLVIMDKGRIVEEGSHAELLRRGGLYAELWARQSGGFLAQDAAE